MKKLTFKITVLLSAGVFLLSILPTPPAAQAATFNKNNIMSDKVFDAWGSMTSAQIQSFLNKFSTSCLRNYQAAYPNSYSSYGSKVSAAVVIKRASNLWHISPRVILATLEKEEGLVTGGSGCASWRYNSAMGVGCPDSGACPAPGYAGFSKQVTKGSWQLKFNKERAYGRTSWDGDGNVTYVGYMTKGNRARVAGGSVTYYDGHATIDGQDVYMSNGPTASLYSYTPHFHGNQSFVNIYSQWFGNPLAIDHSRFITCSGQEYMVERGIRTKRLLSSQAVTAWKLSDKDYVDNDDGCSYPTYDTALTNLAKSRTTGRIYLVDEGKAYYINSQAAANAWGLGNLTTSTYPQLDGDTISENEQTVAELPRLATSTNLDRSDYYLIDGGNRYLISGTEGTDNTSMRLVRGDDKAIPAARMSVTLLQTLTSSTPLDYTFKIGSNWYLLDYTKTRKVNPSDLSIYGDFLSGPTLTNDALSIFIQNTAIGIGFQRPSFYYRVLDNKKVERTASRAVGENWTSEGSPLVTQLLTDKLLAELALTNTVTTAEKNIRIISCGGSKYFVERGIRSKRAVTTDAIAAWGFTNKYFIVNDPGCSYTTFAMTADQLVRSRETGKVYYIDNQKAYYVQSRAAAEAWGFGDTAHQTYPQFNSQSIHDYLQVVSQLPPPPSP